MWLVHYTYKLAALAPRPARAVLWEVGTVSVKRARLGYLQPWRVAAGSGLGLRRQTSLVSTTASPGVKVVWSAAPKVFESERGFVIVSQ